MRNWTRGTLTRASFLGLMLVLLLGGCSNSDGPTAPVNNDSTFKVEDPLDSFMAAVGGRQTDTHFRIGRLVRELGLSEEQAAAVLASYAELRAGFADLRAQVEAGTLTREEAHAAAALLRQAFEADLQVILTADQYARLEELRQNGRRPGHGRRDPRVLWTRLLIEVGADQAQVRAGLVALETLSTGIRALHEQVRHGDITREQAVAAAEVLRREFDAALQSILTAEQYEALLRLRTDHPGRHHP